MKQLLIVILFINLSAIAQQSKDVKLVLEQIQTQQKAWSNGDVNEFMNYYWKDDSLKFIGSKGVTYG